ncbi:MAG: hypothetical protein EOM59_00610 [Clostridia bacterium]|nr:hypothetical protein [Clostridia bacterium]
MKQPSRRKSQPTVKQGQLTINIFAMFMSLFVFLFIQQTGILLINVMFSLGYPSNLDNITNFIGTITMIIVLTFLFGFASQAGYGIIRRTGAEDKIYLVYNVLTLFIIAIQGVTVAMMVAPMYIVPNLLIGAAIIYSLYSVIKGVPKSFIDKISKQKR